MRYSLLIATFLLPILFSCRNDGSKNEYPYDWSLEMSGELKLPLDSTTEFMTFCLQQFSGEGKNYLFFNNFKRGVILIYDLSTRDEVRRINFDREGPNQVGSSPWAFYVLNLDSIFVFSHMEGQLSILNREGDLVMKNFLVTDYWSGDPIPWVSTDLPMKYIKEKKQLLIPGIVRVPVKGYTSSHALINYNIEDKRFLFQVPYPKIYDPGFWVEDNFTRGYTVPELNSKNGTLIAGFGIDHELHKTDGETLLAKSDYLKEFNPVFDEYIKTWDDGIAHKAALLSGSYAALVADPFNNVYYRFVNIPISQSDFDNGERVFRNSVIILDEKFVKRAEVLLEKGVRPYMFFLNEDGLFIANEAVYKNNEDTLTFYKYTLKK